MFLEKLFFGIENLLFRLLKITLSIFGIEQEYSAKTGDILTNSNEAFDLYHDDLTNKETQKKLPVSETLWVFILVVSFLKFVV